MVRYLALVSGLIFAVSEAQADKSLEGIACRSVHLAYKSSEGTTFYNEITVEKSEPGTYFCVCGFNQGYYGIQELGDGKKLLIFSVWEPGRQDDPRSVAADRRVKLVFKNDKVRVRRFGGEGTGGQSFLDYDWKVRQAYRFLVRAKPAGERTEFSAYFFLPEEKKWSHLVTFSTIAGGKMLGGYYSFIEDFQRDRVSATKVRKAAYGNGWVKAKDGKWLFLSRARFTADSNPVTNIDAGTSGGKFFLVTGGDTKDADTPLWQYITCRAAEKQPPKDVLELSGSEDSTPTKPTAKQG